MAAETALAWAMPSMKRPFSAAQVSTEKRPLTSVAVVTAGTAPRASPSRRARALAPPMWPESRGITKRAVSSTASTAGSVRLSRTWGAIARTAMPQAPTNTMASTCRNTAPAKSAKGGAMGAKPSASSRAGA